MDSNVMNEPTAIEEDDTLIEDISIDGMCGVY
jgi:mycofactocin precursor